MNLDQTFIAIRERGMLEIMDLSLQVVRQHFSKLIVLLAVNALPWIVIDWILIGRAANPSSMPDSVPNYYWMMLVLVVSQAQVGTSSITYYLGQAMFIQRFPLKKLIHESFWKPPIYWRLHGVYRCVFPILLLVWLSWSPDDELRVLINLGIIFLLLVNLMVRSVRPFATELVLLERPPVRATRSDQISLAQRSSHLHGGGLLLSRFGVTCLFYPLLFFTLYSMFLLIDSAFALQPTIAFPLKTIYWVVTLWLVAGFAAVVRFLSYIDTRIKQEGWAVELVMRAEGHRLAEGESH